MIAQHIDTAKQKLAKVSTGTVHTGTAKLLDSVRDEFDKGAKKIVAHQKKIRIANHSELNWATIETHESDNLVNDSTNEKRMEKAEKEAAKRRLRKEPREDEGVFPKTCMGMNQRGASKWRP